MSEPSRSALTECRNVADTQAPSKERLDELIRYWDGYDSTEHGVLVLSDTVVALKRLRAALEPAVAPFDWLESVTFMKTNHDERELWTVTLGFNSSAARLAAWEALEAALQPASTATEWESCGHCFTPDECKKRGCQKRSSPPPVLTLEQAYELGWRAAANWMNRDDLPHDIGSPAYLADMRSALTKAVEHRCGVRGFDASKGDVCPACQPVRCGICLETSTHHSECPYAGSGVGK